MFEISEEKLKELQRIMGKKVTREEVQRLLAYFELLNKIKNKYETSTKK